MRTIKLKLTEDEANKLSELVDNSKDTGNDEWDKVLQSISEKIDKSIDDLIF